MSRKGHSLTEREREIERHLNGEDKDTFKSRERAKRDREKEEGGIKRKSEKRQSKIERETE